MKRTPLTIASLLTLSLFAACGDDKPANAAAKVLEGHWHEHLAGGGHGREIQFDLKGDEVMVHGAPREDGGHDHFYGKYTIDGDAMTVSWKEGGKELSFQGKLAGDKLTLTRDGKSVEFERSDEGGH